VRDKKRSIDRAFVYWLIILRCSAVVWVWFVCIGDLQNPPQLVVDVIVIAVIVKIVVFQERFYRGKISRFGSHDKLLHYHRIQFTGNNLESKKCISGGRKEIIVNDQAVEIIEPAFVKNTRVGFDDMRPIKPVDLLFRTLADKIFFFDSGGVNNVLLPGECYECCCFFTFEPLLFFSCDACFRI
jgi:hypothetical protein